MIENDAVVFRENSYVWSLFGVEDDGAMQSQMDQALKHAEGPLLLLSHNPKIIEELKDKEWIVAVLSGYTHGGKFASGCFG